MSAGKFIVIEGPDGGGKTLATQIFASLLKSQVGPEKVVVTREIGGTKIAETIRSMMLNSDQGEHVPPLSRLLMAYVARSQHMANVVTPALFRGQHVVCDRYNLSTRVYQGEIDKMGKFMDLLERTGALDSVAEGPDYLIYLKVDKDLAYERGVKRQNLDNDVYKNNYDRAVAIHEAYDRFAMAGYQAGETFHAYSLDPDTKVLVVDSSTYESQKAGLVKALAFILQDG